MSLKHDSAYRDFFSNKRVVEDLLRAYVGQDWIELLDFSSLQRVNASYVHAAERQRTSDVVWRLRLQGSGDWVYLYLTCYWNFKARSIGIWRCACQSIPGCCIKI